jgi:hypothetical protein
LGTYADDDPIRLVDPDGMSSPPAHPNLLNAIATPASANAFTVAKSSPVTAPVTSASFKVNQCFL